jgi:hypothetical protein
MPEMLAFVGGRFRVMHRAEKTCVDGSTDGMREMRQNDVVFLDDLRCDGRHHGGCGRGCRLFWKEAWLRRTGTDTQLPADAASIEALARRLPTRQSDGNYFCQSSELNRATAPLRRWRRLWKCLRDLRVGTYSPAQMFRLIIRPILAKVSERFESRYPTNSQNATPDLALGLEPGEWVEVKSLPEIIATLDRNGRNRGLQFSYDLMRHCGKRYRVRNRLDRMIIECSGRLITLRNTVILDGITCPCRCVIGGCPRGDLIYWREIWLRRVGGPAAEPAPNRTPASTQNSNSCRHVGS